MTSIENHQIKGITIKNIVVTIISTVSIVASVTTAYFGLKSEIQAVKSDMTTETRINNLRLTVLENQVTLLQKQINEMKYPAKAEQPITLNPVSGSQSLVTANKSK